MTAVSWVVIVLGALNLALFVFTVVMDVRITRRAKSADDHAIAAAGRRGRGGDAK